MDRLGLSVSISLSVITAQLQFFESTALGMFFD